MASAVHHRKALPPLALQLAWRQEYLHLRLIHRYQDRPMSKPQSDDSFLRRVNAATESAAEKVDQEFRPQLEALAARGMDRRLSRRESPEDIVQSVLRTVFRRTAEGQLQFEHRGELWRLLEAVTRHKILKHAEYHRAKKRTPQAEEEREAEALFARTPTADQEVVAKDLIANILEGLDATYAEILACLEAGHSERAIAKRLGCTRRAVTTKIDRLRKRLETLLKDDADDGLET
jgi:RNA polymerase sigma factor (sigma-70 family)